MYRDTTGHGRSTQTWIGNELNTYADDLTALIEQLDLPDVVLVGFSTGRGEVSYIGRHGTGRIRKITLMSSVPPFRLQTEDNPADARRSIPALQDLAYQGSDPGTFPRSSSESVVGVLTDDGEATA